MKFAHIRQSLTEVNFLPLKSHYALLNESCRQTRRALKGKGIKTAAIRKAKKALASSKARRLAS